MPVAWETSQTHAYAQRRWNVHDRPMSTLRSNIPYMFISTGATCQSTAVQNLLRNSCRTVSEVCLESSALVGFVSFSSLRSRIPHSHGKLIPCTGFPCAKLQVKASGGTLHSFLLK